MMQKPMEKRNAGYTVSWKATVNPVWKVSPDHVFSRGLAMVIKISNSRTIKTLTASFRYSRFFIRRRGNAEDQNIHIRIQHFCNFYEHINVRVGFSRFIIGNGLAAYKQFFRKLILSHFIFVSHVSNVFSDVSHSNHLRNIVSYIRGKVTQSIFAQGR